MARTKRRSPSISAVELDLIACIARAAEMMYLKAGHNPPPRNQIEAELQLAHEHRPLRLGEMLQARDTFDFAHDIIGIRNHIDVSTGTMRDHFLPRFSR
jgi:Family of unknown function (DUF6874)